MTLAPSALTGRLLPRPGTPYYHGTGSAPAVEALLSGAPLAARRPEGRSRFAASVRGLSYVTPCFRQAVEYALMADRADWPEGHEILIAARPHVFAFDLSRVSRALPEEDELGWAADLALDVTHGRRGILVDGRRVARTGGLWSTNLMFADGFAGDPQAIEALAAETVRILGGTAGFARLMGRLGKWTSSERSAVGRRLAKAIDAGVGERLVELGISLAIADPVAAVGGWAFDRRGLRSFPECPDEVEAVEGAWAAPAPSGGLRG